MIELDIGKQGAFRQTWREKPFRELLIEIISGSPRGPETRWRKEFCDAIRNDPEYFDSVCDYAFIGALTAIKRAENSVPPTAQQKAERAEESARKAKEHAESVSFIKEQIILLNQEMPNGVRVRFCTLDYMWRLGGKYRSIGVKGSTKKVGEKYNEEDYRRKLGALT